MWMCFSKASKLQLTKRFSYIWILYGWYSEEWWRSSDPAVNCSEDELATVLDRALVIQQYPIDESKPTGVERKSVRVITLI